MCVLVGENIDKRFVQHRNNGFARVNEHIWGDQLQATSLCPGHNTRASDIRGDALYPLQHEEKLSTRKYISYMLSHTSQSSVFIKQAESFRVYSILFYSSYVLGLINRVNPSVTNHNLKMKI